MKRLCAGLDDFTRGGLVSGLGLAVVLGCTFGAPQAPPTRAPSSQEPQRVERPHDSSLSLREPQRVEPSPDSSVSSTVSEPRQGRPLACTRERHEQDQPDDEPGAYQIHVMYVLASDGVDRGFDRDNVIRDAIRKSDDWLASASGGRRFRFDRCAGELDITFARLNISEAQIRERGIYARDAIKDALRARGVTNPTRNKIYLVFYDGSARAETCAAAPGRAHPDDSVATLYLLGEFAQSSVPSCRDSSTLGKGGTGPGYTEFGIVHELFHVMGAVPDCAPNVRSKHTTDDPTDLMYAGSKPWRPSRLDVGNDDYFDHNNVNCYDVANSPFLSPTPARPQLPHDWR